MKNDTEKTIAPFLTWVKEANRQSVLMDGPNDCAQPDIENLNDCSWYNYWLDGETPKNAVQLDWSYG